MGMCGIYFDFVDQVVQVENCMCGGYPNIYNSLF